MAQFDSVADKAAIETAQAWPGAQPAVTIYDYLTRTRDRFPDRPAVSYQLTSGPKDPAETLTWTELHHAVTQTANLFRSLGIGSTDTIAYVLPNAHETLFTLLGGMVAGIVNPINPLLDAEQIAGVLNETNAKVVVTLKSFVKTDVAQKTAEAVRMAPHVQTVLEVDLNRYLTPPKSWIVPLMRPRMDVAHHAKVLDFNRERTKHPATVLEFDDVKQDRVAAYFHTGGTTGTPKVARHKYSGMIYNGWLGSTIIFDETDVLMCPLPLFHVFACYPVMMSVIGAGAHVVLPTPSGYRGDGVFDNFWKLIERWKVTFMITVPTAMSALMQRPVDADVSSLRTAISGSAPMPLELYNRFLEATGIGVAEGYGLTEATCLVSCNPLSGHQKVGSVGIPLPHTDVKILRHNPDGAPHECGVDEIGEICIDNPGVFAGSTYTEEVKNHDLFHHDVYLRTGDLGRIDADGYLWITGRAKDLIIRGGHNIDPAEIEEGLLSHPAVAFVGAIGQPDLYAGELPCAYVELVGDRSVSEKELLDYASSHIQERAAYPKYVEILPELPKTAVGKVFKPDLRKRAILRVYNQALAEAGLAAEVVEVVDDKTRGLTAMLRPTGDVDRDAVMHLLNSFTRPWDWVA